MNATTERLTTAKHSVGFAVDDLAIACKIENQSDRIRHVLKQAAELFDSISQLEETFKVSNDAQLPKPQ